MAIVNATPEVKKIPILSAEEAKKYIKPPLGVQPSYMIYEDRILDLSKAICRYIEFLSTEKGTAKDREFNYRSIITWAKEIQLLAELEIKMEGGE